MIASGRVRCVSCRSHLVMPAIRKGRDLFPFKCQCGKEYLVFDNLVFADDCPRDLLEKAVRLVKESSNLLDLYNRLQTEGEIPLTMLPMDIKTMVYHRPLGINMLYRYWIREELASEGLRFLDIGFGTGHLIVELLNDGALEAFGIDGNPMALLITKKLLDDSQMKQPCMLINHYARLALPFDDDLFDAIFTIHTFHYLDSESQQNLVREMIRITRTGGKIFILGHSNIIYPHETVGGIGTRGRSFIHLVPRPLLNWSLGYDYPIYSLSPRGLEKLFIRHCCNVLSEKEISARIPEEALKKYENRILEKFSKEWLEFSHYSRRVHLKGRKERGRFSSEFSRLFSPRLYLVAKVKK